MYMKKAIYAGSFDLTTNGHKWMIEQGAQLFDELVVAVGTNPDKRTMFSLDERIEMLDSVRGDLENVTVAHFGGLYLVDYAKQVGADYLIKGMRDEKDFSYEKKLLEIGRDINPEIQSVFLIAPAEYSNVSSSMVKSLIGFKNWEEAVRKYVPELVYKKILEKENAN